MGKNFNRYFTKDIEKANTKMKNRPISLTTLKRSMVGSYKFKLMTYEPAIPLIGSTQFSSVQLLSHVQLFVTPWTAALQASLSITNSQSPPKLMSTELVMPSNHLILCRPLLLLPSIFPSIRVFSNESALRSRWPKYWSFSFNISFSGVWRKLTH